MSEAVVLYDVSDRVATITLNRPDHFNALGPEMSELLGDLIQRAGADDGARVVVITGAGRGFCAGGDLGVLADRDGGAMPASEVAIQEQAAARMRTHRRIPLALYAMRKPTIAIINGAAAGAGLSLAAACDLRVASATAKMTTGFANVGRSGDFGGTFFLSRLLGPSRARELYFTADVVTATRALEIGLVDHLHPAETVLTEGLTLARRIASGPPEAIARMKEAFATAEQGDLERLLEAEARLQTISGLSNEGREFLARFMAARER